MTLIEISGVSHFINGSVTAALRILQLQVLCFAIGTPFKEGTDYLICLQRKGPGCEESRTHTTQGILEGSRGIEL